MTTIEHLKTSLATFAPETEIVIGLAYGQGRDLQVEHSAEGRVVLKWKNLDETPWLPKDKHPERMSFSRALEILRTAPGGLKIQRTGWNGKNMWVCLQRPDAHSKITLPYLYLKTAQDDLVPWLISQTDALADDWGVIE